MNRLLLYSLSLGLSTGAVAIAQTSTPGYDVIMLAGQSNMVGYNTTADNPTYAAVSPQVFMWNYNNNTIVQAKDPLIMTGGSYNVGPGLTFAKAYAASIASNRNVLLVGVAAGGTGFNNGWLAPTASNSSNSSLSTNAVTTVNNAMAAAGAGAKFVGIVWDQGENDVDYELSSSYQTNLTNLISYFRTNVTGASSTTPFICTEFTWAWMTDNLSGTTTDVNGNSAVAAQYTIQTVFHQLPDTVNNTAWTASAILASDVPPSRAAGAISTSTPSRSARWACATQTVSLRRSRACLKPKPRWSAPTATSSITVAATRTAPSRSATSARSAEP